jgi:VWA domain-containing protein
MSVQLHFLTPAAAAVFATVALPLAAHVVGRRRVRDVAHALGLAPPQASGRSRAILLVAACGAFALAAAQPYVRVTDLRSLRSDVEAFFVVDVSRSMLAASGPHAATRLARAKSEAAMLRQSIPAVPAGVASFTDRVLPYSFPTVDEQVFASTLRDSVRLESPPPEAVSRVASTFAALETVRSGFFTPGVRRRVCVVLTDGESRAFSADATGRALAAPGGCRLIIVQIWKSDERVYGQNGEAEPQYRPDPAAPAAVEALARAAGGRSFTAGAGAAARAALRAAVGAGPERALGVERRRLALAPWLALAGVFAVLALIASSASPAGLRPVTGDG